MGQTAPLAPGFIKITIGITPGDVVLAVNGHPVTNSKQLRELVAKADKHVALLVRRHEEKRFVAIDLG